MSVLQAQATDDVGEHEVEISRAAIAAYNWLLGAVGGRIHTHAWGDGGLLCEKRTNRARPIIWRVSAEGEVLPDSPYHYALRTFVTAGLPAAPLPSETRPRIDSLRLC